MPIHDWTRVPAGTCHFFHQRWISALADALNAGGLPEGYFAMSIDRAEPKCSMFCADCGRWRLPRRPCRFTRWRSASWRVCRS